MSESAPVPLVLSANQRRELARDIAIELASMLADAPSAPQRTNRLVDSAELARQLGVSRDTIYAHAEELGGGRIGNGPRGRLRFDLDIALECWMHRSVGEGSAGGDVAAQAQKTRRRRGPAMGSAGELLPIRGAAPIRASE